MEWDETAADRLRSAVFSAGHTQRQAIAELVEDHGLAAPPAQPTFSRWTTGRSVPAPEARASLASYIAAHCNTATDAPDPVWSASVAELTGEPLLGPRQARLVDALTDRLLEGRDIGEPEERVIVRLMRNLGLITDT